MKLLEFKGYNGNPVFVVANCITGFCVCGTDKSKVFISTGADSQDGGENGWVVSNTMEEVKAIIENA